MNQYGSGSGGMEPSTRPDFEEESGTSGLGFCGQRPYSVHLARDLARFAAIRPPRDPRAAPKGR